MPVTTDEQAIRHFLEQPGDRVVFSTYHSSGQVALAVLDANLPFDLVVADEAHQLAGFTKRDYACVLHEDLLPARRRLFFTATTRVHTGKHNRDGDDDIASMDDPDLFGAVVHRLSFGEAIQRGLLSDYRVIVVGVTDREAHHLAERRMRGQAICAGVRLRDCQRDLLAEFGVERSGGECRAEVQIRFESRRSDRHCLHHLGSHAEFGLDAVQKLLCFSASRGRVDC